MNESIVYKLVRESDKVIVSEGSAKEMFRQKRKTSGTFVGVGSVRSQLGEVFESPADLTLIQGTDPAPVNTVSKDARALSSGTISYLIGDTSYAVIDKVQAEFIKFCEERHGEFETWKEAWKAFDIFRKSPPAEEYPLVEGEGALQYTFDVPNEAQLGLL
jgi:hypothetical protein